MTQYLSQTPQIPTADPTGAGVRLLCFPYAGGGASAYRRWQRGLDEHGAGTRVMPVQLPGREGRMNERRFTDLDALIDDMDEQLDEELEHPYVLYGHSMGALIAYGLAHRRQQRGATLPLALVLSSYRAPHLPAPRIADPGASDEELVAGLAALGGIPRVILNHPEFLAALLPVARDDLLLCTSPVAAAAEPLRIPLHLFIGARDRLVSVPEVVAWRRHAGRGCEVREMPGGHFFIRAHEDTFLRELAVLLRRYAHAPALAGPLPV
ncbi:MULTISPECIES: thioesterase II family protein [unclassified Streptomyces]|uniref:thioesterase II family protein n=1 Tax=unclassified Streptomyces TaxID=2593676 RepID=UPI0022502ED5|nr:MULTISPECIES: alpha/beta fold hydrolase [unclassified Streptomyces]MCX5141897.1 alpha/beta fold hydrolase [Streptomyces sp. NBC_00338]WRZ66372.1 alpha/beta fold hydrolase [Streptomyces sp. NBC_01257]